MIAECWIPTSDMEDVRSALSQGAVCHKFLFFSQKKILFLFVPLKLRANVWTRSSDYPIKRSNFRSQLARSSFLCSMRWATTKLHQRISPLTSSRSHTRWANCFTGIGTVTNAYTKIRFIEMDAISFKNIVDSYGVADYKELNPG